MKIYLRVLLPVLLIAACTKPEEASIPVKDVAFAIPDPLEIAYGAPEISFRIQFSKAPAATDLIVISGAGGQGECKIKGIAQTSFSVDISTLWDGRLTDGPAKVYLKRGSEQFLKGSTEVRIINSGSSGDGLDPSTTVYGSVACAGKGVEGVVVSDGVETARTDADGFYQLASAKEHGYVFISIPSGYGVGSNGILPLFHKQLEKNARTPERVDFQLTEDPGQDSHTMLMMGDIHLANRTNDRKQFNTFVKDVNSYVSSHSGDHIYALTLGDMTWDYYWLDNNYGYVEYLRDANAINGVQIFHTIGNHDHSMYFPGDFKTVTEYKQLIAPTYYSFNIGKVHYVVLDNIECTNSTLNPDRTDGAYERTYNQDIVNQQIQWLRKDLSYIPKTTPLCITMHAPLYNDVGSYALDGASVFTDIVNDFNQVQIFTGHTHKMYNVDKTASEHIFEHNCGAVCATWWWSANETPGVHVAQDGAPGGYEIVKVNGTDFSWQFKASGSPLEHQFRSYDRNTMEITADKYVSSGNATHKTEFEKYNSTWASPKSDNQVFINVWNYDPAWKVEVSENGKALQVERLSNSGVRDPLHLVAYTAQRLNKNKTASFPTTANKHTFRVWASGPSTTLEIKVTDRFGNVYTESMKRPKVFSADIYHNQ